MEISYQGLRIVLPLEGVIQAEDFQLEAAFNRQAWVHLLLLMEEEGIETSIHELADGAKIAVYENELLFVGKVITAGMETIKGLHYLKLSAVSFTYDWDLTAVSQSFLNLDATYEQVLNKVLENQPKADILDCITKGAVIPDFLLQYEETDWGFLLRLASRFQSFVIPDYKADYGRAYFGIPQLLDECELCEEDYEIVKDLDHFYHTNLSGELLSQEAMKWEVKTGLSLVLAQPVSFRGIRTLVTKIRYETVAGELCRFYELSRERGCLSVPLKNDHINGMSIPATVKERSGNCIRAHFHIDPTYDSAANIKFFTFAIESSFIYCMPEVGSQVHIYFPSDEESDAVAVHALRMQSSGSGGQSGASSGGGYAQDPDYKSFSNVSGAELLLGPDFADASAEAGKTTSITLNAEGNAYIKGNEIDLSATRNVMLGEAVGDGGAVTAKVTLYGTSITAKIGGDDGPGIDLTEEAKIMAAFINLKASDTTPASNPSASEVFDAVTASDQANRDAINEGASAQLVEKYEEGRNQFFSGAVRILTTVAAVAVAVTITVATGGLAAAAAGPLLATYALAGGIVVTSAADMLEGAAEVEKALTGSLDQSFNFVRDTVFGGNQTAYDIAKMINDIAFGIVCGKVIGGGFNQLGKANKFFKFTCSTEKARQLQTALQISGNVCSGALNDLAYTGKIDVGKLAANTVIGGIQGRLGGRISDGILNRVGAGNLSGITSYAARVGVNTLVDTGLDAFFSPLLGKEFDFWDSLRTNAFTNALSESISDPVDAVSGGYLIQATDFILASVPTALKLERSYSSVRTSVSVMGRGWVFPYASRIFRDTANNSRVHLDTITGHKICFEKQEGKWINQSAGTGRFSLMEDAIQNVYILTDVICHTACVYDETGRLSQIEYPNRQRMRFQYNEEGLAKIITPLENCLDVVCRHGTIIQITDEIGRRTQYRYEGDLLTDVIYTDEGIAHYEYDKRGYISAVTDENGIHYLTNEYDDNGRIIKQIFKDGVVQDFYYDDRNRINTVTYSESGKTEQYEYRKDLLPLRVRYEDGTEKTYEYSDDHQRTAAVDRLGVKTRWEYDAYGRLLCEIKADGFASHYEYDEKHDRIREWDTDGRETIRFYDEEHNLLLVREKISDLQWKETTFEYDRVGRKTAETDSLGNVTRYEYEPNRAYPRRVITPKREETVYQYDAVGRRMAITNNYGTVQLSYNSRNFVTGRTDGEGNTTHWIYDQMGNLKSYYPARHWKNQEPGYQYHYDYLERRIDTVTPLNEHHRVMRDFDGNIIQQIHPVSYQEHRENGEGTRYEYDRDGNCIRIHYPDSGTERRFYDAGGHMIRQIMPEDYDRKSDSGSAFTYEYDIRGRLIQITDPDHNILRRYTYNGHDQVLCETDGEGKETWYEYNGLGQPVKERVSIRTAGEETCYRVKAYTYDRQGNKVMESYGVEEVKRNQEPESWHRIRFAYDANHHLIRVEDDFGAKIRYDYDSLGNVILEERHVEEGIRHLTRYSYNKNGWRIRREEDIQENGSINRAVTHYSYDENGNVTKIKTPGGYEIRHAYDANDRLIETRTRDKKNGIDRRVSYGYDAAGNRIRETVLGAGGETLTTTYQYDLKDRLTHSESPGEGAIRYLYDQNDRLIRELRPYGGEAENGAGTSYRYDSRGNRIRETNALGQKVKEQTYNLQNRVTVQVDGLGNRTEYEYTPSEELKEIRIGNQKDQKVVQSYEYNARGQIIGIVDGNGAATRYDLDGWGRITGTVFADGCREGYEYNLSGQVSKVIDANGNAVTYRYNSLGKLREREDQLGDREFFVYDEEGNLACYTDREGRQTTWLYNVFGNPVYERAVDREGKHPCITTYVYDSIGRITRAVCDGHSYEYRYNEQGLLSEKRSSGKRLIAYEYDSAGQIIQLTDPAGVSTRYERDILGRIVRANSDGMEVFYTYDCLNRLTSQRYGNGVTTDYQYDESGNVSRLETKKDGEILLSLDYQYDGNGNRIKKQGQQRLVSGESSTIHTTYRYSVRNQLTEETHPEAMFRYSYDAAGNRLGKDAPDGVTTYQYNAKNQLVCEEGARGKRVFTYDRQGSIITEEGSFGTRNYLYNSKNQQTGVKREDGQIQINRYDPEGLRCEMKENEALLRFVYHNGELLYEKGGAEETSYHLGYGIQALRRNQETFYYHQDEQLSTALITDQTGEVKNHYQYSAFGEMLKSAETVTNRIGYTGQQYDGLTGQYYLRARYYNPIVGRFMQEDVYQGDGLNLYAYCGNNPVVYYDPSGYAKSLTCPGIAGNGGDGGNGGTNIPDGYYQDTNGDWHRPDGKYASNVEVGMPAPGSNKTESEGGRGRLGTEATRAQNTQIGDYLEEQGYTVTGGGGRGPEEYLPGPNGGNKGSNYLDITATKDGNTVRINTVDVYADGKTPTIREQNAANSIHSKTGGTTILIPKGAGLGNLPNILNK